MENIKKWCSNKENIKILFMIGMAILLIVVLKHRFSGNSAKTSDSSAVSHETVMKAQTQDGTGGFDKRIQDKAPARSQTVKFNGLKSPPFLKRDLFYSGNPEIMPIRKAGQMERNNLELTATIIDDQGALAIIGNEVLGMGEMIKGFRVTAIKNNEVILSKGEKQHVLRVSEE
jgi:hypothetical protein